MRCAWRETVAKWVYFGLFGFAGFFNGINRMLKDTALKFIQKKVFCATEQGLVIGKCISKTGIIYEQVLIEGKGLAFVLLHLVCE